jgi:hemerythrin superfamily protein
MPVDVVDLIMADHREVERLFSELREKPDERANLVPVLTALLSAHSRAEEAEVYPAARDEAGETDEVAHSQEEHLQADELLKKLGAADPATPEFEEVLGELVEAVTHHVGEEESKVLPGIRERLDERRRTELAEAFAASRAQHLGDPPPDLTREERETQARNAGVPGASSMTKDELIDELTPRS